MKTLLKNILNKFNYDLNKVVQDPWMEMYQRLYPKESIDKKCFYNIGAGSFFHPCWTNIDNPGGWYDKYRNEQSRLIPFDLFSMQHISVDDNSAEIIYTSHTIEHTTNDAVQHVFNEAYRMLKKGGTLRVITPDIELQHRAWKANDRDYFFWINNYVAKQDYERVMLTQPMNKASTAQIFLEDFASNACMLHADGAEKKITDNELEKIFSEMKLEDALDYCIACCSIEKQKKYPFNHINWFNYDKLHNMLMRAGFNTIYRSAYLQSQSPVLRNSNYFDRTLPQVSLYVEVRK